MAKNILKLKNLHDEFTDCVEHVATYGLDDLSESDKVLARKISILALEFQEILEEELNYEADEDEEE